MTFKSLDIVEPILSALEQEGYTHPTPIQSQAIPPILRRFGDTMPRIIGCPAYFVLK